MSVFRNTLTTALLCLAAMGLNAQVVITPAHKERAKELVSQMTTLEKIHFIASAKSFYTYPVERLGIPQIRMADGPQGIRNNTVSTLYPSGILTAATWNGDLAYRLGASLASDAKARGVRVVLGPGVNIYRAPLCGRNYEYFGEDPWLSGETAVQYILGVQDQGVMATVKHFAANNQERSRHSMSSDVDERTLMEIYFPAFRRSVQEAGVGAVMDSYNLVNSVHSTENRWMNVDVLRDMWGFDGIVMSDWTSVYSTLGALNGGLDLECPVPRYFRPETILPLLENGVVDEAVIDEKVQHLLQTFIAFGFLDTPAKDASIPEDNPESRKTALDIAREGIVLLKNEGTLPLSKKGKVLVIGPNADCIPTGGGSGFVTPFSTITVKDGLLSLRKKNVTFLPDSVLYRTILPEVEFKASYYLGEKLQGEPLFTLTEADPSHRWGYGSPRKDLPNDGFSVRWEGTWKASGTGQLRFLMAGDDGYRLYADGKLLGGDWGNHALSSRSIFLDVEEGREYNFRFEFYEHAGEATVDFKAGLLDEKAFEKALSGCTDVVYCCGFDSNLEGEGFDRPFSLPAHQRNMISRLEGKKLTVVINAGGAVEMDSWLDKADAVLMAWYPGQEGGTAIAEILTGAISPSGKLPISIERKWEDNPVHDTYFNADGKNRTTYSEGLFYGYRGYDRSGVKPLYPFGFGMSYSSFQYSNLSVEKDADGNVNVCFDVKNTGKMDAAECAQVYVRDVEASLIRPLKELKGSDKHFIKKGVVVRYQVTLGPDAFSFYDPSQKAFVIEKGEFEIMVGPSSATLPLIETIKL